jgi:sugar lactone lactonase YvrE
MLGAREDVTSPQTKGPIMSTNAAVRFAPACRPSLPPPATAAPALRRSRWLGGAALALLAALPLGCAASHWPTTTAATQLVRLDATQGQMSEGLALRDGRAYVSFSASGEVVEVDLATSKLTPYTSLPKPGAGTGFYGGLTFRGNDLYGALISFAPDVQPGIYRATTAGAPATLFAKDPGMVFPNGLQFDEAGQLYVTDSAAGAVFRISPAGVVTRWASDPLLSGGKDSCGAGKGVGVPFDIGANGIVKKGDAFYVTNTDKATVLRIPVQADGTAGAPTVFAGPDCAQLSGADGLAVAPDGDLIVASNHLNQLTRVEGNGRVSPLLTGAPLDFPSSLVFSDGALYINNFAFLDTQNPGLLRLR